MPVSFHTESCSYAFKSRRRTSAWLRDCAVREGRRCGAVNVIFCSDDYLLGMNRRFLGHDYYTDVITFDYSEGVAIAGDIYISVDTVARNASDYGATPEREMLRVIIHGVLHLCGYGDKTDEEAAVMRQKEDFYLSIPDRETAKTDAQGV